MGMNVGAPSESCSARAPSMRAFSNLVNVGGPMDMFFSNSISRGSCGVSASTTSRSWMTLIFFHPVIISFLNYQHQMILFVLHQIRYGDLQVAVFATPIAHQRFVICDMDFHTFAGAASTRVVLRTVVEKPVTTMAYNGMLCLYVLAARCFYYIRL